MAMSNPASAAIVWLTSLAIERGVGFGEVEGGADLARVEAGDAQQVASFADLSSKTVFRHRGTPGRAGAEGTRVVGWASRFLVECDPCHLSFGFFRRKLTDGAIRTVTKKEHCRNDKDQHTRADQCTG
jgi:hypothetical protein